jgi:ATP-dependent DNA ligase
MSVQKGDSIQEISLHPCFVVFDIVYFNGKSLSDTALESRYKILKENINEEPNFMEILPHQVRNTKDDIFEALKEHMLRCEEGIIIKDPRAYYTPGLDRTRWIKIKPEYIG